MADTMADSSAQNAGVFGDVLNSIVSSLPPDAAPSFFRCLAGLTATESNMLASYMCELKDEKKFRVIQALMDAPVPAKQKFLNGVKEKFDSVKQHTEARPRATLRQSSLQNVTSEDIRSMGNRLDNTHIGESELRLRRLEEAKTDDNSDYVKPELKSDLMINKRERPDSNWELLKGEAAPAQKTRDDSSEEDDEDDDEVDAENSPQGASTAELNEEDAPSTKRWTKAQDAALKESVRIHGEKNWKAIAERVPGRNHAQCLQRWRKVLKPGLVKGHWSFEEDKILEVLVKQSVNNWGQIAEQIPGRTPKQCRERWRNHLDPSINKGPYSEEEDQLILSNQARLGNKWSQIAQMLPGRTEDSVKIRWKSLKQNPTRAAAANAQSRRIMQQQQQQQQMHHHSHHHLSHPGSMHGGYQQPSMLHQHEAMLSGNSWSHYADMGGSHMALLNDSYMPAQAPGGYQQSPHDLHMMQNNNTVSHMKPEMYVAHYPPAMHHHPPPPQPAWNQGDAYDVELMKSLTDELDFDEFGVI
ncbi:unnamed protein product [Aphanomyces euteiches]|uniref:Myb-like DNA-binding protein n=1 Tax=Aphanomyces euteiches TaxID=100861 RepID=A0A6G0WIR3_9STRA|nr:hypothetical protein Ae201684_014836 [Aphanomyces euteiches]KAH9143451.1 hypothetical protein AeRB84_012547 [Aphanomyces euteiches]